MRQVEYREVQEVRRLEGEHGVDGASGEDEALSKGPERNSVQAAQHADGVDVDHRDSLSPSLTQDGGGGVRTDARQADKVVVAVWNRAPGHNSLSEIDEPLRP